MSSYDGLSERPYPVDGSWFTSYGDMARRQASGKYGYSQSLLPNQSSFLSSRSTHSAPGHQPDNDMLHSTDQLLRRLLESLPDGARVLFPGFTTDPQSPVFFPLKTYKNALDKAKDGWPEKGLFNLEYQTAKAYGILRNILIAALDVEAARLGYLGGSSTMGQACSCVKQAITALCRNTRNESYHWTEHKCTCPRPVGPHPTVGFRSYSPDEGSKAIKGYIEMIQRLWESEEIEGESIFGPPT